VKPSHLLGLIGLFAGATGPRRGEAKEGGPTQPPAGAARVPVPSERVCNPVASVLTVRVVRAGGPAINDATLTLYDRTTGTDIRRIAGAALGDGRYVLFTAEDRPTADTPRDAFGVRVEWQGRDRRVPLRLVTRTVGGCETTVVESPAVISLR
jgi:hypothetical protein